MLNLLRYVLPLFAEDKPNHILGIADPASIEHGVASGADTFDSCFPTRVARYDTLLTRDGPLHIQQGKYKRQMGPIDPTMPWVGGDPRVELYDASVHASPQSDARAALRHLASMWNVKYMTNLMAETRERVLADDL